MNHIDEIPYSLLRYYENIDNRIICTFYKIVYRIFNANVNALRNIYFNYSKPYKRHIIIMPDWW
jgi:hypothetical protein